jgi:2'-deoxynucleoside 5'-phosphate N-hydrolase
MKIKFPYMPKGRTIKYVPEKNKFMLAAKKMTEKSGCAKQPTGAVLVKDGKIIGRGVNAAKKIDVCPRVLKGSKTGEDYYLCKKYCLQEGHGEATAVKDAKKHGYETRGGDVYLYGHWWCCKNCWDSMIGAGIKNVYLLEKAYEKFDFSSKIGKIYVSGALTVMGKKKNLKNIYEKIAGICSTVCSNVYVPHLGGTDPIKNPQISPKSVWAKDYHEVESADLVVAYGGTPSLGVGAELEIARATGAKIILWWFKGEKVSRMARGNPAVSHQIEVKDEKELEKKLREILKKF